jgi:hypothetical protein
LALLDLNIVDVLQYDNCADSMAALIRAFHEYREAVADREIRRAQPVETKRKWWWQK